MMTFLRMMLPGLRTERVEGSTEEGRKLIAGHGIRLLPAYIFDPDVTQASNFERMSMMFQPSGAEYLLDAGRAGSSVRVHRPFQAGKLDVFVSPGSQGACRVALEVIGWIDPEARNREAVVHYISHRPGDPGPPENPSVREEIERQLIVRALYPNRHLEYFRARCEQASDPGWEEAAEKLGVDTRKVREAAESGLGRELLMKEEELVKELELQGEVAFLFNNREVVSRADKETIRKALERLREQEQEPEERQKAESRSQNTE